MGVPWGLGAVGGWGGSQAAPNHSLQPGLQCPQRWPGQQALGPAWGETEPAPHVNWEPILQWCPADLLLERPGSMEKALGPRPFLQPGQESAAVSRERGGFKHSLAQG